VSKPRRAGSPPILGTRGSIELGARGPHRRLPAARRSFSPRGSTPFDHGCVEARHGTVIRPPNKARIDFSRLSRAKTRLRSCRRLNSRIGRNCRRWWSLLADRWAVTPKRMIVDASPRECRVQSESSGGASFAFWRSWEDPHSDQQFLGRSATGKRASVSASP